MLRSKISEESFLTCYVRQAAIFFLSVVADYRYNRKSFLAHPRCHYCCNIYTIFSGLCMKSKALLGFVLCYSTNPELYIKVMRIQGITANQNSFV